MPDSAVFRRDEDRGQDQSQNAPFTREHLPTSRRAAGVGFAYFRDVLGACVSPGGHPHHRAAMTISSLFFSPETKHLELHEVGSQYAAPELERQAATADESTSPVLRRVREDSESPPS